ncbi:hypothetical protein [Lagierella massiliensis]|uniref:hypothetical protein n=1 Tax=Lagierella massiliensis TaxID=1689303 RepID=UPI0006D79A7D|nr:hypothetical protein [Lagierella massiliensis]
MENNNYDKIFTKPIIRVGRAVNLLAVITSLFPAFMLYFKFDTFPGIASILKGWGLVLSVFLIVAIVEAVSYFPVLGLSGTYMSFIAGNIGNMRVPCSLIAQESLGTQPGTKKAELVSTLGIAGSVVTNIIVVTVAAIGGQALMSIFPPAVLESFTYVAPSILGAAFGMYAVKDLKLGLLALSTGLIMLLVLKINSFAIMIPANVLISILVAVFVYKKSINK